MGKQQHIFDAGMDSSEEITRRLRRQAQTERVRITLHAHQEMAEEYVSLDDVLSVLRTAKLIDDYPEHKRGACCLVCGFTEGGRPLHVVCPTALSLAIIITVYEPKLPKWATPFERGKAR